jgi:hypothetical protein
MLESGFGFLTVFLAVGGAMTGELAIMKLEILLLSYQIRRWLSNRRVFGVWQVRAMDGSVEFYHWVVSAYILCVHKATAIEGDLN